MKRKYPIISLLVAGAAIGLSGFPAMFDQLVFNRSLFAAGEWWRLLTGHLVHVSGEHLVWDAVAFLILGYLCETRFGPKFLSLFLTGSAAAISMTLFLLKPELEMYCGLSGLDTALFVLFTVNEFVDSRKRHDMIMTFVFFCGLIGVIAKITGEYLLGTTFFCPAGPSGFIAVPLAHAVGLVIGFLTCSLGKSFSVIRKAVKIKP